MTSPVTQSKVTTERLSDLFEKLISSLRGQGAADLATTDLLKDPSGERHLQLAIKLQELSPNLIGGRYFVITTDKFEIASQALKELSTRSGECLPELLGLVAYLKTSGWLSEGGKLA